MIMHDPDKGLHVTDPDESWCVHLPQACAPSC